MLLELAHLLKGVYDVTRDVKNVIVIVQLNLMLGRATDEGTEVTVSLCIVLFNALLDYTSNKDSLTFISCILFILYFVCC